MTAQIILTNNRPVTYHDYVKTFQVSKPKALQLLRDDKKEARCRMYMVSHFYKLWDMYPAKFHPKLEVYEVNTGQKRSN